MADDLEVKQGDIPKALYKGELFISEEITIPCYVLDDERRVLYQRAIIPALGLARGGSSKGGGDRLAHFVSGKAISSFLDEETIEVTKAPFLFELPEERKQTAYGYEATVLVDICDAVLRAREAGALQTQQLHIAKQCEILMRAFAKVGIIALVDEATGYQYVRARRALEEIVQQFISDELHKWTKTFPDEFYRELFRLRGWKHSVVPLKRPGVVVHLTNDIVYDRLAPGVKTELKKLTPKTEKGNRAHRFHQRLTRDVGHPTLRDHLAGVLALMRASSSWNRFYQSLEKAYPKFGSSEPLFYPDEHKGDPDTSPGVTKAQFEKALAKASKAK